MSQEITFIGLRSLDLLPLCGPLHIALLQNLISMLLFEVHLKTPVAMSFFTRSAPQRAFLPPESLHAPMEPSLPGWGAPPIWVCQKHSDISVCPVNGDALHSIQLWPNWAWWELFNILEGTPSGPFFSIMNFLRATFKIKVSSQRRFLPSGIG